MCVCVCVCVRVCMHLLIREACQIRVHIHVCVSAVHVTVIIQMRHVIFCPHTIAPATGLRRFRAVTGARVDKAQAAAWFGRWWWVLYVCVCVQFA